MSRNVEHLRKHMFKKGEVHNPRGAGAHDPIKREFRHLTSALFKEVVEHALTMNVEGLRAIVKNPDTPAVKVGVATALMKAITNGDWKTLDGIVERLIGKVKIEIDHTSAGKALASSQSNVHVYLPTNGRQAPYPLPNTVDLPEKKE